MGRAVVQKFPVGSKSSTARSDDRLPMLDTFFSVASDSSMLPRQKLFPLPRWPMIIETNSLMVSMETRFGGPVERSASRPMNIWSVLLAAPRTMSPVIVGSIRNFIMCLVPLPSKFAECPINYVNSLGLCIIKSSVKCVKKLSRL